jgi:hypothetical protein
MTCVRDRRLGKYSQTIGNICIISHVPRELRCFLRKTKLIVFEGDSAVPRASRQMGHRSRPYRVLTNSVIIWMVKV